MNRYIRTINCIGEENQKKLQSASVLIVGCGALGGQAGMLLAGSGIEKIGLVDFDTVDITNLQRQLFFTESETGSSKVQTLSKKIKGINSEIEVDEYETLLTRHNAQSIITKYEFIVDATDNPASKIMIEDLAKCYGLPCCIGGVTEWTGQVITIIPGSRGMKDIFGEISDSCGLMSCEIKGVMGPAASVIASVQASEAIKFFLNKEDCLINKVLLINLKDNIFTIIDV